MNLYFLLEGRRTEPKVYPAWLSTLLPDFQRIGNASDAIKYNYYLISGQGFPRLLDVTLSDSIADIAEHGGYNYLIIIVDADDESFSDRWEEVDQYVREHLIALGDCAVKIIVQNNCIETWFLGNRRVFSRSPQDVVLRQYVQHFDVYLDDPEQMSKPVYFRASKAEFHHQYLKLMLDERNIKYTKKHPREVREKYYLDQLRERVIKTPAHLQSFQDFLSFCEAIS